MSHEDDLQDAKDDALRERGSRKYNCHDGMCGATDCERCGGGPEDDEPEELDASEAQESEEITVE